MSLYVDLKALVIFCQHKVQSSMSTLKPLTFFVNIERNFCVDSKNVDLNNSTPCKQ